MKEFEIVEKLPLIKDYLKVLHIMGVDADIINQTWKDILNGVYENF